MCAKSRLSGFSGFFTVLLLLFVLVSFACLPVSAAGTTYQNTDLGVSFTIPDGWVEGETSGVVLGTIVFEPKVRNGEFFTFRTIPGTFDTSNDSLNKTSLAEGLDLTESDISVKQISGLKYYECVSNSIYRRYLFHVTDDKCYEFSYFFYAIGLENEAHTKDLYNMIGTATYPAGGSAVHTGTKVAATASNYTIFGGGIKSASSHKSWPFNNLIVSMFLYILPILIYRFIIRRKPVPPNNAKNIAGIYFAVSFLVEATLTFLHLGGIGVGIFLLSFVNYGILATGYKRSIVRRLAAIQSQSENGSL